MLDKIRVLPITDGRTVDYGFGNGDGNFVKVQVKTFCLPEEEEIPEIEFPARQNQYPDAVCVCSLQWRKLMRPRKPHGTRNAKSIHNLYQTGYRNACTFFETHERCQLWKRS